MDPRSFDDIARACTITWTRRRALSVLGGALFGIDAVALDGEARRKKKKKKCKKGTVKCGQRCVDTQTDAANCGACNASCGGRACANGVCQSPGGSGCPAGQTLCGQGCVNLQTDTANCGACGEICQSGHVCTGGRCAGSSCGSGPGCPEGQICVTSHCECDVQNGYQACGNGCTQTRSDPLNCGGCGLVCFNEPAVCLFSTCCTAEAQTCSRASLDACCSRYCGTDQRCHACGAHADCHAQGLPDDEICQAGRCCRPGGTPCSGRGYPCCSGICDPVAPPGVGHVCR